MAVETYIYSPETLISAFTSRPTTNIKKKPLIFWCDTCQLKLITVRSALQHLNGRPHKMKIDGKNAPPSKQKDVPKRKRSVDSKKINPGEPVVEEPPLKKSKEKEAKPVKTDPNLKCDDCDVVFSTAIAAIQHFKGKKHIKKIAAKSIAKKSQTVSRQQGRGAALQTQSQRGGERGGQRGGRGRKGRGGGRGDGLGRGYGLMRGVINRDGRFDDGGGISMNVQYKHGPPDQISDHFVNPLSIKSINSISSPQENLYEKLNNFRNTTGDDFRNNPSGNMHRNEPRNDVGGYRKDDFYGNSSHSNYGTPQYESNDHPTQPKRYFTSPNVGLPKDTFSGGPPKDMYDNNVQVSRNDYYDHPSPLPPRKSNFSGGSSHNYGNDYNSNNYSNSSESYNITTDETYDSFYSK